MARGKIINSNNIWKALFANHLATNCCICSAKRSDHAASRYYTNKTNSEQVACQDGIPRVLQQTTFQCTTTRNAVHGTQKSKMISKAKQNLSRTTTTSTSDEKLWLFSSKLRFSFAVVVAVISIIFLPVLFSNPTPIITIEDGQIQGKSAYSRDGREYWLFASIPYATPPLGKLRWKPPVPAERWEGVKQTTRYPPYCAQFEAVVTQTVFGVEDCLFVNVFTHPFKSGSTPNRPVLVHIHGGGFIAGSSRLYRPDYFMDFENLVVVTFNYRLGPFGFLNFDHDSETDGVDLPRGNMGMKDQLLVLKWVQANIVHFGGDKNAVALVGESAGAVAVNLHVLSTQSRGLFHRAISMSGSSYCSWGFTTKPREMAYNFAKKLNCPTENSSMLLECLENYDALEMVKFQVSVTDPSLPKDNLSPSVESVIRQDTFLHKAPSEILKSGNFSHVPYLMGVASADGALRSGRFEALPSRIKDLQFNWTQMLGNVLLLDNFPDSVADRARTFYFGNYSNYINLDSQSFLNTLTQLFSDVFAFEPVQRAAIGHAKSDAPTYLYYYNYKPHVFPGIYSAFKACTPDDWLPREIKVALTVVSDWINEHLLGGNGAHQYGVAHGEDIFQLWNVEGLTKLTNAWEVEFSQSFVKSIVEFTQGHELKFKKVIWPRITIPKDNSTGSKVLPYMLMDNSGQGKVIPEPFASRVNFWKSVGISTFN